MAVFKREKQFRLQGYDYSKDGYYFVTICTHEKEDLFGDVVNDTMILNGIGKIAADCWLKIPKHFPFVKLDEFVVMPNHMHGIIVIDNNKKNIRIDACCRNGQLTVPTKTLTVPTKTLTVPTKTDGFQPQPNSLSIVIRTYKAAVTTLARSRNFDYFAWQRRFHDHIIRNKQELYAIRKYIKNNPKNWFRDDILMSP